jgi:hypothetical protein
MPACSKEARALWQYPDAETLKGKRDRAVLALLLGCVSDGSFFDAITLEQTARRRAADWISRARTAVQNCSKTDDRQKTPGVVNGIRAIRRDSLDVKSIHEHHAT